MAFDPAPDSWIEDWTEDGTDVTFPLASVSGLTATLADATDGDWRSCFVSFLEHTYSYLCALSSADRPAHITISRDVYLAQDGTTKLSFSVIADIDSVVLGETVTMESET